MMDGGWSKYDHEQAIAQLEVLIRVITTLDRQYATEKFGIVKKDNINRQK